MTFKQIIVKWHGEERGAQAALSRAARVKRCTVSDWCLGWYRPSSLRLKSLAKILNTEAALLAKGLPERRLQRGMASNKTKAIADVASLVLTHSGDKDPTVKNAMEIILDLCKGGKA